MTATIENPKLQVLLSRLKQVTKTSNGWEACCPAHDDTRPSLSIHAADNGKILLRCHSNGCNAANIMQCVGMFASDMMPPRQSSGRSEWGQLVAAYSYCDENGVQLFEVCRFEKIERQSDGTERKTKTFRQRHKVGDEWVWKMKGVRRVLYRLPQLLAAKEEPVFLVEGEKAVEYLVSIGLCATCNPQGAGKWQDEFAECLRGRDVIIVPDNDSVGMEHAESVADSLTGKAATIHVFRLPGAEEKWGLDDWLQKGGHELEELESLLAAATPWSEQECRLSEDRPATKKAKRIVDDWTDLADDQGRTDRANARRFLKRHGDRVRFCHSWRKWLNWTGSHWEVDDGSAAVLRLGMETADSIWFDAVMYRDDSAVVGFARNTSSAGRIAAMLKLAAADVPVSVDDLDANPWLLNCANGTVDLRTGELRPHRREDNLTKLCPTNFNRDAGSYHFDRFLEGVFDGHGPTIDFLQRFFGYCLTGDVREQILAVFHGIGSNGKSTLLTAIEDTLGRDFSSAAPPSLLIEKKTDRHPTELATLFGKRLIIAQETNAGARLAEATVKQLTGGDMISARRMKEDFWTFAPTHKIALVTNHRPRIVGNDHAIWRRLVLVPFVRKFWNPDKGETGPAELRQDKTLPAKLKAEAEGILAWMVRGCLDWQRNGLQIPDSVRAATAEYRSEQDTLGRFVEQCCIISGMVRVRFSQLYEALTKWCEEGGDNLPAKRFVSSWLKEREFKDTTNNGLWFLGIALKAESSQ